MLSIYDSQEWVCGIWKVEMKYKFWSLLKSPCRLSNELVGFLQGKITVHPLGWNMPGLPCQCDLGVSC